MSDVSLPGGGGAGGCSNREEEGGVGAEVTVTSEKVSATQIGSVAVSCELEVRSSVIAHQKPDIRSSGSSQCPCFETMATDFGFQYETLHGLVFKAHPFFTRGE